MASRMAQPASTRSARSAPMQGLAARSIETHRHQLGHDARYFVVGQPAAVDAPPIVALQPQIDAGDRRHRARGAERVETVEIAVVGRERVDEGCDLRHHRIVAIARHDFAAVALGECDDANRQRGPADDIGRRRASPTVFRGPVEPHQFRRPAADVEQNDARCGGIEQLGATGRGEPRLGGGVDDLQFDARLPGDAAAELFAVLGGAAGCRGNEPGADNIPRSHLVAADLERLDRAHESRLADPAGRGNAFAEADNAGERIDDPEAVGGWPRDQEPAIVGAEVERGIGRLGVLLDRHAPLIAIAIAANAIWRPATPARPVRGPVGAEAAARRGLVVHPTPSCRAGTSFGSTATGYCSSLNPGNFNRGRREGNTAPLPCTSHVPRPVAAVWQVHYHRD